MTPVEMTKAISDKAAALLPGLLSAATLDNFLHYRNKSPLNADDLEFCVYIHEDDDTEEALDFKVIIQVQLFGKDLEQEYHSVIMPFLKDEITSDLIGLDEREGITSDHYPMDLKSSSFIYYGIAFTSYLDDCGD